MIQKIIEATYSPFDSVNRYFYEVANRQTTKTQEATKNIFIPEFPQDWSPNFLHVQRNHELLHDSSNADFEYLVKVQIADGLQKGQKITLETNEGPATYIVYKKIATEGLVSYALKPECPNQSPLIVFRCTEPDPCKEHSFHSMQNDTDSNIGERGWRAARKTFRELMGDRDFRDKGQFVKIGGYSLGGAHAQHFLAEHHARVSHAIFYNDPSIQPAICEAFANNIKKEKREKPLVLQIFRNWGDPFHHFGGKHLGCDVNHPKVHTQLLEIRFPNQTKFDTDMHSQRVFKTDRYDYRVEEFTDPKVLAKKLDNSRRDPFSGVAEQYRKRYTPFLSPLLGQMSRIKTYILSLKN